LRPPSGQRGVGLGSLSRALAFNYHSMLGRPEWLRGRVAARGGYPAYF
jgi:hypothetical protein